MNTPPTPTPPSEATPVQASELQSCPFCNFTAADYEDHKRRCRDASPFSHYLPEIAYERLLSSWCVQCNNCGVEVVLHLPRSDRADAVARWNSLPRPTAHAARLAAVEAENGRLKEAHRLAAAVAELARLRAALQQIADQQQHDGDAETHMHDMADIAAAALAAKQEVSK